MRFLPAAAGCASALLWLACSRPTDSTRITTQAPITRADEAQAALSRLDTMCQTVVSTVPLGFVGPYAVGAVAGTALVTGSKTVRDSSWCCDEVGHWSDTTADLTVALQSFQTAGGLTANGTAACWHSGFYEETAGFNPYHGTWAIYALKDSLAGQDLAISFSYQGVLYDERVTFAGCRVAPIGSCSQTGTLTTHAGLTFNFP